MKKSNYKKAVLLVLTTFGLMNVSLASENTGCVIAGPDNAEVTIQEFSDFECPYCAKGADTVKQILKNYPGKIKLIFRNRPLPFHTNAAIAAKAFTAVCMQSPALAYTYQQEIFENQDKLSKEGESFLFETAKKIGVNLIQMKSDMNSELVAEKIKEDIKLADSLNFNGTPSFLINSEPLKGARSYEEMKSIIDRNLKQ